MKKQDCPLISIAIPTFNRAHGYFRETLQSARNQDYPNIEIIVADNASMDNTEEFVKAISDQRIRYFKHPVNMTPNDNFNFCLHQAHGDYFLLLHDDDLIDECFISSCMAAIRDSQEPGIIRTGVRTIDDRGGVKCVHVNQADSLSPQDFFLSWFTYIKPSIPIYQCNTLFNTKQLKKEGGFKTRTDLYQDVAAIAKLVNKYGHANVHEPLASYRRHGENFGRASRISDWCDDSLYLLDLICTEINTNSRLLRRAGLKYLNRVCYTRAAQLKSPMERLKAYAIVYRKFNFRRSPISYFWRNTSRRLMKYIKHSLRAA